MKNLGRIWRYLHDYTGSLVGYLVCTLLASAFGAASIGMLAPVLNVLFRGERMETPKPDAGWFATTMYDLKLLLLSGSSPAQTLLAICGILVVAITLKNIFLYSAASILIPLRHDIIRRLRNEMFQKVLSMPLGYFSEERKGTLMSRMTHDIEEVKTSIMSVMEVFIREPISILIYLGLMVAISPQLSLFFLLFLPIAGLIIGKIGSSLRRSGRKISANMADITSVLDDTLFGIRVVKAFNAEKIQMERFEQLNDENYQMRNKAIRRQELASPVNETLGVMMVAIILYTGGKLVLNGDSGLSAESFITYIALFTQLISPIKNLTSAVNQVQKGTAALEQMELIMNAPNLLPEKPDAQPIHAFTDKVEFRNVSFSYGDRKILDDVSLTLKKGQTLALIGASGAGKSTFSDLLPRFQDVSSGAVLIDGHDLRDLRMTDLRSLIGIVNQEPILFNDTIRNNIVLGTERVATEEEVAAAARVAHAWNFIQARPEGLDTVVGDRGNRLSGGERQRLTIARAVFKDPPILILDEATSSLDTESERLVQQAINEVMKGRTCLVIAHRLSTIRHADKIVVFENGKIVEEGTHEALMAKDGVYRRLVQIQDIR